MSENEKINEDVSENEIESNETAAVSDSPIHEPKQNYVIYTIISILLFAALYSCWKFVVPKIFRDYTISVNGDNLTAEQLETVKKCTEIDCESISEAVFQRTKGNASFVIYYENIDSEEDFVDNCIKFEYGDPEEDVRSEIYPYGNSVPEYVYGERYVNIGNPDVSCFVFEYNGGIYAEYRSSDVNAEITSLFSGKEKIYSK